MHHWELLLLGLIAGGTIYIGLPLGRLHGLSSKTRAALSMLAAGILVYLLVEILGEAAAQASGGVLSAVGHSGSADTAALEILVFIAGFFIGFMSLVLLQQKWVLHAADSGSQRLSLMIAAGIGLHNLSEGLAIGQSFALGKAVLAIGLVIGFALHNATEGFGIVGPAVREGKRISWREMLLLGAIGGGPTFLGTLLGNVWTSEPLSVFVMSMAGGAILYVVKELFAGVRKEAAQSFVMSALVLGFAIGWGTEVVASANMASESANGAEHVVREPDGDIIPANGKAAEPKVSLSSQEVSEQDKIAYDMLRERAMVPTILPDGTKEFELTASAFPWQLYPGKVIQAWGYNRQVPGPLIRVRVGDKVAIVLRNELPQPTTLHLHGLAVPIAMDGVPQMTMGDMSVGTQKPIPPGGSFTTGLR